MRLSPPLRFGARGLCAGAALAVTVLHPAPARAQPTAQPPAQIPTSTGSSLETSEELHWKPQWRRLHPLDYAATGAFGAAATADRFAPSPTEVNWTGGILLDDAVRDAVLLGGHEARQVVARASDVTVGLLVTYPLLLDTAAVAWLARDSADVAWHMFVINVQAFTFTSAVTGAVKRLTRRERPISAGCRRDPAHDPSCDDGRRLRSFFSGHTSSAFTGAGLMCMHHAQLELYGGAGDAIACAAASLAAVSVAWERVASDRHYASDVLTGAAVGALSGAFMPWLMFYRPTDHGAATARWLALPMVDDTMVGLRFAGSL